MKSFLQATAFLFVLLFSSSTALTVQPSSESSPSDIVSVAGSTGDDYVWITFTPPCTDCAVGTTDSLLELDLFIQTSQFECLPDPVFINGAPLTMLDDQQLLTFPSRNPDHSNVPVVTADIRFTCLGSQASVVSVNIISVGDHDVSGSRTGFTASFTQIGRPQILRLKPAPFAYTGDDEADWLSPGLDKKVVVAQHSSFPAAIPGDLEKELMNLDILKSRLKDLKKQIRQQEATIMSIWKSEFAKCSSIKCYLKTAVDKAPALAHLIAKHIRHHSHVAVEFFNNATHFNCSKTPEQLATQTETSESAHQVFDTYHADDAEVIEETFPTSILASRSADPALPTSTGSPASVGLPEETEASSSPFDRPQGPPPWAGHRRPPWAKPGGRPPWGSGPPPWAKPGGRPPWGDGPPPWVKDGRKPPWADHGNRPSFDSESQSPQHFIPSLTAQQIWRIRLIGAVIGILVVTLFAACVFTCIKHKARIFRDPRRRVELKAAREEWKNKRAYRKAACKHRWRTFVRSVCPMSKSDEEEKQGLMTGQDDLVVNREISNLRAAHQLVGEMMRAEEGESGFTAPISPTLPRSDSLPSYSSAPPGYASGQEGDISVVDGFTNYTPSNTDDTPDSSVVDCSPRMSFETQRTS